MKAIFARIFCLNRDRQSNSLDDDSMGPETQTIYKCQNCKHVSFLPGPHRLHVASCLPGSKLSIASSNYRVSKSLAKSRHSGGTVATRLSKQETRKLFEDIRMVGKGHKATPSSPGYWASLEREELEDIVKIVRKLRVQPIDLRCQGEVQYLYRYAKERCMRTYLISKQWVDDYFAYLKGREHRIPGSINNKVIEESERRGQLMLQHTQNGIAVNELIWEFFVNMYGGGPEIRVTNREISHLFIYEIENAKKNPRAENIGSMNAYEDTDFGSRSEILNGKLSLMSNKKLTIDFLNGVTFGAFKVKGLANEKLYCYMNSVLQVLLGITELVQYIEAGEYHKKLKNPKSKYWTAIADAILRANSCSTSPLSLSTSSKDFGQPYFIPTELRKLATSRFRSSEQHDVHEFLCYVLGGMQDEMNLPRPNVNIDFKNPNTAWEYHLQYNLSKVDTLFAGQFISKVVCGKCEKVSVTFEPFLELTVPIIPGETKTLNECFNVLEVKEDIKTGYKCEKCKTKNNAWKQLSIQKLPKVLIVHINRFRMQPKKIKIDGIIDFPINEWKVPKETDQVSEPYKLVGIISHTGVVDSGHYTAYTKRDNDWYHCDDEKVRKVSDDQIDKSEAYILFYERIPEQESN